MKDNPERKEGKREKEKEEKEKRQKDQEARSKPNKIQRANDSKGQTICRSKIKAKLARILKF